MLLLIRLTFFLYVQQQSQSKIEKKLYQISKPTASVGSLDFLLFLFDVPAEFILVYYTQQYWIKLQNKISSFIVCQQIQNIVAFFVFFFFE